MRWGRILGAVALPLAALLLVGALDAQSSGPLRRSRKPGGQGIVPRSAPDRPAQNRQARRSGPDATGQLLRLMQMSAAERERFFRTNPRFRRLGPARKAALQKRLAELDRLPAEEKEVLLQRYQLFSRLPRSQQAEARSLYSRWRDLERDRRTAVSAAVRRLRRSDAAARERTLASPRFENAFGEEERSLIAEILTLTPNEPAADR